MGEIKWSDIAIEDINAIAEYIAKDSPTYANMQVDRFFERIEILSSYPYAGRQVPELNDLNMRELNVGNFRIIYEVVNDESIYILTVLHGARNIDIPNP